MWKEFNNNPCGRRVGDCAVRAVSVALGIDWEDAYEMITRAGYWMCDMPSSDAVWGAAPGRRHTSATLTHHMKEEATRTPTS